MSEAEFVKILRTNHNKMLLTKKETAEELNVSPMTIDRLRQTGQLKSKKVLGSIMFSVDEIARFINES